MLYVPRLLIFSLCLTLLPALASAQQIDRDWAEKMFSIEKLDFGYVAKGADTKARIEIKNIYNEDVHISNVRTTCGCTAAEPDRNLLKTYEVAYVNVDMDTRRFSHEKTSNIIVTFDRPRYAEVRIPVRMYVRTDVVLSPGSVNFGDVEIGEGGERTIDIQYAGRDSWSIVDVKTSSDLIKAEVVEKRRSTGRANYDLVVQLSDTAELGPIRERISLMTDDAKNPVVPVLVQGTVEPDITVTPSPLPLGRMRVGQRKMLNVVLRGKDSFEIESIECESEDEAFSVRIPSRSSTVHVLPMTVVAPDKPGKYTEEFTVTIPGRPEPVRFTAAGEIIGS
ncbi:DUF1573 domain-containing protein [Calycomorphotria hydatis]|uniref:DUF1573 domain-containing protein n=1 Tax=Calycomorphotria hydatis TaxID=2528027 RepID=A0A517T608_9PLAN|nr:DUF1573 domain-containing protein [Calycomorphotria hydatis]QDT63809.1 hypothetical protein V22_10340 [Calycomorphotria hydatis]